MAKPFAHSIRNFCILAHIDHGKSTLADRLMEQTGAVDKRDQKEQFLDSMDIERERGITIKAQTVSLSYTAKDNQKYQINLIDTPGHVDFSYEVSRSIAACEGALLVVDATQGVQAQTLANVYMALKHNLSIITVVNKIDLPAAEPEKVALEIEQLLDLPKEKAIFCSAKTGAGIQEILERVVAEVPSPKENLGETLRALVFDSWFDPYLGAVILFRVVEGIVRVNDDILLMSNHRTFQTVRLGKFCPQEKTYQQLQAGEVGYLAASIKNTKDVNIGDTITLKAKPATEILEGYEPVKPMVYSGIYPTDSQQYPALQDALARLQLNDSSISYEAESSTALGFGYRCGFLGMLHMEIVRERLEREFNLDLLITAPTVVYKVITKKHGEQEIDNPNQMPEAGALQSIEEPFILGIVYLPSEYLGAVMQLALERRGVHKDLDYMPNQRVRLRYEFPLNEVVTNFYDRLKSVSKGYASFDYEKIGYRPANLVKLDILLNGKPIDALSAIVHKEKAQLRGRELVERIKTLIPRQMFEIAIQAAIGGKIIARETISAMRKNVTAKCYGGDITRKRKLLEKQKKGKKRMKRLGEVDVPQEAFLSLLKL